MTMTIRGTRVGLVFMVPIGSEQRRERRPVRWLLDVHAKARSK